MDFGHPLLYLTYTLVSIGFLRMLFMSQLPLQTSENGDKNNLWEGTTEEMPNKICICAFSKHICCSIDPFTFSSARWLKSEVPIGDIDLVFGKTKSHTFWQGKPKNHLIHHEHEHSPNDMQDSNANSNQNICS